MIKIQFKSAWTVVHSEFKFSIYIIMPKVILPIYSWKDYRPIEKQLFQNFVILEIALIKLYLQYKKYFKS